jgi:hypothetical protein
MSTLPHFEALGAALAGNRYSAVIYARADGGIGFWNAALRHCSATPKKRPWGSRRPDRAGEISGDAPGRVRSGDRLRVARQRRLGPVEGLHKNGERVALEIFLTPIHEASEHASGVLGLFRVPSSG